MWHTLLLLIAVFCILRFYYIYFYKIYTCKSQKGKVFIITGANSGIGKECVRQLAEMDATVILACRNKQAAEEAISDIRTITSNGELIFHHVDMAVLASVRKFADEVKKKYPKIDVLINNAGVITENARTVDGFEIHFAVNYLAPFLLTQLLLPKLVESAPSRIVNVASLMSSLGRIYLEDLHADQPMTSFGHNYFFAIASYSHSKLAMIYHTRELAERLKGANVDVRAVCPGLISTKIHEGYKTLKHSWLYIIAQPAFWLISEPLWKGAHKVMQLATDENLEGESGDFHMYFQRAKPILNKMDPRVQKKLWQVSEQLVH